MHLSPLPELPGVSYVMPVLNEAKYLKNAVETILNQDYLGDKEIILALAPSDDGTQEIAEELSATDSRVRVILNPERDIPIGLNLAVADSQYPVIIRVDAHSALSSDYTRTGVAFLREKSAANVGGTMRAEGISAAQRAIAAGYNSPVGLGGGTYHGDGSSREAESAYLGIFRREAIEQVGGYDPKIRRGEDWELNLRIRRAGGSIWFTPELSVTYWPRDSFARLSQQFYATGAWRAELVKRYPSEHPWRFFAPGVLVLGLMISCIIASADLFGANLGFWWKCFYLIPATYALGIIVSCSILPGLRTVQERALGAFTLVTMHLSWGLGFLKGLVFGASSVVDRSRARSVDL